MQVGLWGRLGLRSQAAVAVLTPCMVLAIVAAVFFPQRLNREVERSLLQRASALGAMASAELGPTVRLVEDGLASLEEIDAIFAAFAGVPQDDEKGRQVDLSRTEVVYLGVFGIVDGKVDASRPIRQAGDVPEAVAVPAGEGCAFDNQAVLVMRCRYQSEKSEGLFVAGFRKDSLIALQRENQSFGILAGVGAAILGLIVALLFSRALVAPVSLVTQAAREVAAGDVTVNAVEVVAAGEIRSMASSFNEMLSNLRNLVGQMVSLTGRLGEASQGLITASRDQEQVTSQQAAYAQQIAATFEELSRTAEQISNSTQVVETAARNTNEAVEEARAVVSQMVGGISNIRTESTEVAEAISKLNADLQQVSKIAQVINQVAERSDLLALNAALEGTKAGEVGRGFSLVAAEMRKLAENVSGSARDIGRIVEKVLESGNEAVSKARVGVAASDEGGRVAEQASEVFARIVELARGTTEAAQQISVATRQQQESSDQAVLGARNVADLVKQGVDATGRTTKIAQDLESVAQALHAVTGRFRVMRN